MRDIARAKVDFANSDQKEEDFTEEKPIAPHELTTAQPLVKEETVEAYREKIRAGEKLEPVEISIINGEKHVDDGNHRAAAALLEGVNVPAKIVDLDAAARARGEPTVRPKRS